MQCEPNVSKLSLYKKMDTEILLRNIFLLFLSIPIIYHMTVYLSLASYSVGTQLLTTSNFIGPSYHAALLFSGLRSIVLLSFCCRSIVFSANQRRRS